MGTAELGEAGGGCGGAWGHIGVHGFTLAMCFAGDPGPFQQGTT